jgi:hypothetical protein
MYPLVERWQASQKDKKSFCEEEQINLHTFVYWLKKYNRTKKEQSTSAVSDFVELQVDNRFVTEATSLVFAEISYPNGVALRLHKPMSSADLRSLIQS